MKILLVNTFDINGGAARAAYRLHRSLLNEGIDSQMLVQAKTSDDYTVIAHETKVQKDLAKLRPTLDSMPIKFYKNRTKTLFSPAFLPSFGLAERINALNADVVHLHWINAGMLRIEELAKIRLPTTNHIEPIIIAHRLSTTRSCDRVIKKGKAEDE